MRISLYRRNLTKNHLYTDWLAALAAGHFCVQREYCLTGSIVLTGVMQMRCAWQAYLSLLPMWMRREVDEQGRESLRELRLRLGMPPELVRTNGSVWLQRQVASEDLSYCVNAASRYSPWNAETAAQGYLTAQGGHRIGLCGEGVIQNGTMSGIRRTSSLCIRVARDFPGIAEKARKVHGSILIVGKPGSGKTTLLRDLIRQRSDTGPGSVAVVDERGELFPHAQGTSCFPPGKRTDILTGCGKAQGIDAVLRAMGPSCIAVDEITAQEDCQALLRAGWCGVTLLATAHASNRRDVQTRPVYRPLAESGLFDTLMIMQPDKSWRIERMDI